MGVSFKIRKRSASFTRNGSSTPNFSRAKPHKGAPAARVDVSAYPAITEKPQGRERSAGALFRSGLLKETPMLLSVYEVGENVDVEPALW